MDNEQLKRILDLLKFAELHESGVMINREDVYPLLTILENNINERS